MNSTPTSTKTSGDSPKRDALASLRIDRGESSRKSSSGMGWLVWLILLGLMGGGAYFGYQYSLQNGWKPDSVLPEIMQKRVEVKLQSVTVRKGRSADAVVVATGYLESRRQARIGARAAGLIDVVNFEEGDRVEEDQLLAELDHKDLDASLAASRASIARAKSSLSEQDVVIEQAETEFRRAERLWKSRSISRSEFDQPKFAYQSAVARKNSIVAEIALAEAQARQAEQLRENMFIRAPFTGTVISKDAEVGESIMPGGMGGGSGRGSVATIADLDHLEIECDVQEDLISRVTEKQEADIAVDAVQSKKYRGFVRKIIPMGDRARATIKVKVTITDADKYLFPEMSGTVYFLPTEKKLEESEEPRIFCPTDAITTDSDGNQFVWVVDKEKRAQKIAIKSGDENEDRTEILSGLEGRERVITNPSELEVGTPVRVAE